MSNKPRKQHYVTKSYLSLFCIKENKTPIFYVYDLERKSFRKSQPLNEACEKNFQTLDDNEDPFFLEKKLSSYEELGVKAIHKIIEKGINKKNISDLINWIALLFTRSSYMKRNISESSKQLKLIELEVIYRREMKKLQTPPLMKIFLQR